MSTLREDNARLSGHTNIHQKIQHVQALKDEMSKLQEVGVHTDTTRRNSDWEIISDNDKSLSDATVGRRRGQLVMGMDGSGYRDCISVPSTGVSYSGDVFRDCASTTQHNVTNDEVFRDCLPSTVSNLCDNSVFESPGVAKKESGSDSSDFGFEEYKPPGDNDIFVVVNGLPSTSEVCGVVEKAQDCLVELELSGSGESVGELKGDGDIKKHEVNGNVSSGSTESDIEVIKVETSDVAGEPHKMMQSDVLLSQYSTDVEYCDAKEDNLDILEAMNALSLNVDDINTGSNCDIKLESQTLADEVMKPECVPGLGMGQGPECGETEGVDDILVDLALECEELPSSVISEQNGDDFKQFVRDCEVIPSAYDDTKVYHETRAIFAEPTAPPINDVQQADDMTIVESGDNFKSQINVEGISDEDLVCDMMTVINKASATPNGVKEEPGEVIINETDDTDSIEPCGKPDFEGKQSLDFNFSSMKLIDHSKGNEVIANVSAVSTESDIEVIMVETPSNDLNESDVEVIMIETPSNESDVEVTMVETPCNESDVEVIMVETAVMAKQDGIMSNEAAEKRCLCDSVGVVYENGAVDVESLSVGELAADAAVDIESPSVAQADAAVDIESPSVAQADAAVDIESPSVAQADAAVDIESPSVAQADAAVDIESPSVAQADAAVDIESPSVAQADAAVDIESPSVAQADAAVDIESPSVAQADAAVDIESPSVAQADAAVDIESPSVAQADAAVDIESPSVAQADAAVDIESPSVAQADAAVDIESPSVAQADAAVDIESPSVAQADAAVDIESPSVAQADAAVDIEIWSVAEADNAVDNESPSVAEPDSCTAVDIESPSVTEADATVDIEFPSADTESQLAADAAINIKSPSVAELTTASDAVVDIENPSVAELTEATDDTESPPVVADSSAAASGSSVPPAAVCNHGNSATDCTLKDALIASLPESVLDEPIVERTGSQMGLEHARLPSKDLTVQSGWEAMDRDATDSIVV